MPATRKKSKLTDTRKKLLGEFAEPTPGVRPLLPNRWWDHAGAAMAPDRPTPILVVSPQVAEVINMGIDRAIDVTTRVKRDLDITQDRLNHYQREYEWVREFMRNVRDRIGPIDDNVDMFTPGHREFLVDLARSLDLLEQGLPT